MSPHNPNLVERRATPNDYRAEDGTDRRFYIQGSLSGGTLSFTVVAEVGGVRGAVSGHEFFAAMMAHFGSTFQVILAMWTTGVYDTNLRIFNRETRGKPATRANNEAAAWKTFTGVWASQHHFKTIGDIDVNPLHSPGAYDQVLVEFVR